MSTSDRVNVAETGTDQGVECRGAGEDQHRPEENTVNEPQQPRLITLAVGDDDVADEILRWELLAEGQS